ncbi:uncharacterized protein PRCAT00000987001 [Priceomyces carsonii]|uniref:uncharacterized protein n=1 Tax=Priceomyces carsonii TaxID=28549 RepID=UPI002EDBB7BE|nr:unnamed protein product [Priceomyces carsonii]
MILNGRIMELAQFTTRSSSTNVKILIFNPFNMLQRSLLKVHLNGVIKVRAFPVGWLRATYRFNSSAININPSSHTSTSVSLKDTQPNDDIQVRSTEYYMNEYKTYFPRDSATGSLIDNYSSLKNSGNGVIKIGIIYEDETAATKSKIIEDILADPLSSKNQSILEVLKSRTRKYNNKFVYSSDVSVEDGNDVSTFQIPSPLLSSYFWPKYMIPSNCDMARNFELWEINDLSNANECHFFIKVVSSVTSIRASDTFDTVRFYVIDNTEYTSASDEDMNISTDLQPQERVIKIDSQKLFEGISMLMKYDTKAASKYLDSLKGSNIFELLKTIGLFLVDTNIEKLLLNGIIFNIKESMVGPNSLSETYDEIRENGIIEFSSSIHSELQNSFIPKTNHFFRSKLSWWKLYIKNDNVEYDLKDFFSSNFMNESIEKYNYYRGQVVSRLQQQKYANYALEREFYNPLINLKKNVINVKVPNEVQSTVYTTLTKGFFYYQMPISVLSYLSYFYFHFSPNSAVALGLFGWILGFNYVSKSWTKFTKKWLKELFEEIRVCLSSQCIDKGVLKELNKKYDQEAELLSLKQSILRGIMKSQ